LLSKGPWLGDYLVGRAVEITGSGSVDRFSRVAAKGQSMANRRRKPILGTSVIAGLRATLLALVFGAVALAGCAGGRGGPIPYEPSYLGAPDVQAYPVASVSGPIGALDKLYINVFRTEALSGDFIVDEAGSINYPLLGTIKVEGKTAQELGVELAGRLRERYLQNPNVTVAVTQRAEQTVTVDGSVKQPGRFTIRGPSSLVQVVSMAHGVSEDANASRVIVLRTINGQRLAGAFDLKEIQHAQSEDPPIYGNDVIVVDGSRGRALFRNLLSAVTIFGILRPFGG
jgi:polysaccharide export outer membrane protein